MSGDRAIAMPETDFDRAFDGLKARDVALASASAIRILIEFMVESGISRDKIEASFRAKAGELIGQQYEDNAANLLRMMAGAVKPRERGE